MQSVEAYVTGKCSLPRLKKFCQDVFSREIPANLKDRITVHYSILPIANNGYVQVRKHKDGYWYRLYINLLPFLMGQYTSNRMRLFYLYATIVHEVKHVELLESERANDYGELLAFWEEYRNFSKLRVIDDMGLLLMRKTAHVSRKRRYRVSVAEIICNLSGFQRSYTALYPYLAESERDTIENMIHSLAFLKQHIAITYSNRNHPYSLFPKMIREAQTVLKKDTDRIENDLKPMNMLFQREGHLKPMEQLFYERTDLNGSVVDGLLINWFICADMDFSAIFQRNSELKKHIEELANQYCRSSIEYLKDSAIGKVFLDDAILQDNAAMLIKNVDRLNKLVARYNMVRSAGSVIPLYNTGK